MIDFWMAVVLTAVIALLTVFADWLAWRLITSARKNRETDEIVDSGLPLTEKFERLKRSRENYERGQSSALVWGSDLATVALSIDCAALGIWTHKPDLFPFLAIFSGDGISRDVPAWLIIIGLDFLLLIASLALKHRHADCLIAITFPKAISRTIGGQILKNRWMFAANSIGGISLLTSIVVFTNALP